MTRRIDWILVAMLGLSVAGNIYLFGRLDSPARRADATSPKKPSVGDRMPAILGTRIDGTSVQINYDNPMPTLVYVFSPSCVWCDKNAENIRRLVDAVRSRFTVVGVSSAAVTATDAYAKGLPPEFVVQNVGPELLHQANLPVTPMTVVVDRDGRISNVWSGAWSKETLQQVERALGVVVPAEDATPKVR